MVLSAEESVRWTNYIGLNVSDIYKVVHCSMVGDPESVRCLIPPPTMQQEQLVTFYASALPDTTTLYNRIPVPCLNHTLLSPPRVTPSSSTLEWSATFGYSSYWLTDTVFATLVREDGSDLYLHVEYDDPNLAVAALTPLPSEAYFTSFLYR